MADMMRERAWALGAADRARLDRVLSPKEIAAWTLDWAEWAHGGQVAPPGDWRTWVMVAGRGYGKTRAGAQWVLSLVRGARPVRIALVAATEAEARRIMIEGPSGLLAQAAIPGDPGGRAGIARGMRPRFEPSRRRLVFPNGSEATLYSGANPEALRGPQHDFAWCDELAKWRHPEGCWDMLQMGLRCGTRPRALVTTTPRQGCTALARILAAKDTVQTRGGTRENPHLPEAFVEAMLASYGGTRLGRQELDGELLADAAGTLWPIELIEASRGAPPHPDDLVRVVIGVDPPTSAEGTCGIVACGLDRAGMAHVLSDHSLSGVSPEGWARQVAGAALALRADRVVAEGNQGGEMVRSVLLGADISLPVRIVHARLGKSARAVPVAAQFELGRVRLAGRFGPLEAQLGGMIAGGAYEGPGRSPDRADAMVWALTALLLEREIDPRVSLP